MDPRIANPPTATRTIDPTTKSSMEAAVGKQPMGIGAGVLLPTVIANIPPDGCGMSFAHRGTDSRGAWFMLIPIPTSEEEWAWVDRLTCIRAIYVPVSYKSGEKYPDLCTYIHVNFMQMKNIGIEHQKYTSGSGLSKEMRNVKITEKWGLDVDGKTALGINPARLITALIIPRDSRKIDTFSSKSIVLMDSDDIPNAPPPPPPLEQEFDDNCMADVSVVYGDMQSLDITWGKADMSSPWFVDYFKNAMAFAIGYIPIVGPFATIGWNLAISAIFDDHEAFMDELREQILSVQLLEGFVEEVKKVAAEGKPMIRDDIESKKRKVKEEEHVAFDKEALKKAGEAAKEKAARKEKEKQTDGEKKKKDSVFHTLGPGTLARLALDNYGALLKLLNEPEPSPEGERDYYSSDEPRTTITRLPFGDSDELADLLEKLSQKGEVKYGEGWEKLELPKNEYGREQINKPLAYSNTWLLLVFSCIIHTNRSVLFHMDEELKSDPGLRQLM
ncbi:uncharacterized protein BDV17DRAFT_287081 [Aspergillus undulatus]|uniref:uncharacterized protein n=1 Tax=Aspergillus undulatus TaxID=1810928 RepID=UPI003CCD3588